MATITVRRTSGGGLLGLPVFVDGEKIGRVRPSKEISHEVEPGPHEVIVKRIPAKVKAELEVAEGDHIRLVCSEAGGFTPSGRVSSGAVGKALFTAEGGLTLGFDEDPSQN